jgi:hypothetical protein
MKSQSQQRREKIMQATPKGGSQPAWKQAQQKETTSKDNDQRDAEKKEGQYQTRTVKMKTDYRDVAKKGDKWTTDSQKAEELVSLGRAEYAE